MSAATRGVPVIALAVLAFLVPTAAALAQGAAASALVQPRDAQAAATTPAASADPLQEARAQLAEARRRRDEAAGSPGSETRSPSASIRFRLLDWLVDLRGEKVKRLEEIAALQSAPRPNAADDPLVRALASPPPYSALQVDALRDEIDGLRESLAAAEASLRGSQKEMQRLQDQLKDSAAAARLAADPPSSAGRGGEVGGAPEQRQVADLRRLAAESELSVSALAQQSLQLRIAALGSRIEGLQAVVARVLPDQRLSPADLAVQRQRVASEGDRLAAEAAAVGRRYAQHRTERERLDADGRLEGSDGNQRAAFLELAIKTDNALLKGLDDLQVLTGLAGDSWEQRYVVLSSVDSDKRRAALSALRSLQAKLADWLGASGTRQEALRTEIREQRVRIGSLDRAGRASSAESARLELLQQQAAMDERVELAATRLERQVSRWLADFPTAGGQDLAARARWLGERAADLLARVWQQELFVVEDASELDGRRVSVQYSVTVGKSIGIFVVFALGYWLLSLLSRAVQRQLVRRFKVSHQAASVTHRGLMIALCTALVVVILNLARIPLSVFAFLGGALAIGVGFGAQTIIKNFISGLIVLLERKVRVGDVVELGGLKGQVTAVDLRATTVRGDNGEEAVIPNANFVENQVVNWTYSNPRVRRELRLGIAYGADVGLAEIQFLAAAIKNPHVLRDPAPEVFFEDFGDSALAMVLVYWVDLNGPVAARRIGSDLRHDLSARLARAGIGIPFPQQEVQVTITQPVPVRTTHERYLGAVNGR